jgi:putative MATE family efflux protein
MMMVGSLLRGSGDAVRPMAFMITATVINIILDPFLIFGLGPFPELGVRGAALATVIAQTLGAGLGFYYIVAQKSAYRVKLLHLRPNLPVLHDIYRVGFPSMIIQIMEGVIFALVNYILSAFGSLALAAVGILIRIVDLAFMPMFGVSMGLLPIVGFSFGARLWNRLWRAFKLSSVGLMVFMAAATVVIEIFAPDLISIFNDAPELLAIAVPAMRIGLAALVLTGPAILAVTTLQGLGKGKEALFLSLVRQLFFFVPLLFILSRILGLNGVWLSFPITDVLAFIASVLWLFREYRLQQRTGTWVDVPVPEIDPKK